MARRGRPAQTADAPAREGPAAAGDRLMVTTAADVPMRRLDWFWPHRFPAGMFCLIAGVQDSGKSLVTIDMASRVTRGEPWPDLPGGTNPAGSVIIVNVEDDLARVVRPRLAAAGADLRRVHFIRGVERSGVADAGLVALGDHAGLIGELARRIGDVRLIVLDPLTAYMGQVRGGKEEEVRPVLQQVGALAESTGAMVLGVMHWKKEETAEAIHRVLGSVAFTAVPRAVWMIGHHRGAEPGTKMMVKSKMNLAKAAPAMLFRVEDQSGHGRVVWLGVEDGLQDAQELVGDRRPSPGPAVAAAASWLSDRLAGGPVEAVDVEREGLAAGHAVASLQRAKRLLGIQSTHGGPRTPRLWCLPAQSPEGAQA